LSGLDAGAVERAKAGAAHWLEQPECLKLLTEFTDRDGHTLDRSLASWGISAAEYLLMLPFRDGAAIPRCGAMRIELVTVPGLPQVYVCPGGSGPRTAASRGPRRRVPHWRRPW
jgi:hypothetical protein